MKSILLEIKTLLEEENIDWLNNYLEKINTTLPIDILDNITKYILENDINSKNKAINIINNYKEEKSFFQKLFN